MGSHNTGLHLITGNQYKKVDNDGRLKKPGILRNQLYEMKTLDNETIDIRAFKETPFDNEYAALFYPAADRSFQNYEQLGLTVSDRGIMTYIAHIRGKGKVKVGKFNPKNSPSYTLSMIEKLKKDEFLKNKKIAVGGFEEGAYHAMLAALHDSQRPVFQKEPNLSALILIAPPHSLPLSNSNYANPVPHLKKHANKIMRAVAQRYGPSIFGYQLPVFEETDIIEEPDLDLISAFKNRKLKDHAFPPTLIIAPRNDPVQYEKAEQLALTLVEEYPQVRFREVPGLTYEKVGTYEKLDKNVTLDLAGHIVEFLTDNHTTISSDAVQEGLRPLRKLDRSITDLPR